MPIYEFVCPHCGSRFEYFKKYGSTEPTPCENCGAADTERAVSPASFQLAGSGWASDGYR